MRMALLVGATPSQNKKGPSVDLWDGQWKIVTNRVVDTIVTTFRDDVPLQNDVFDGPCKVYVEITKPGREKYISVFAERVK